MKLTAKQPVDKAARFGFFTPTGHCTLTEISDQPITGQQLSVFGPVDMVKDDLLKLKPSVRIGKKGDVSDF